MEARRKPGGRLTVGWRYNGRARRFMAAAVATQHNPDLGAFFRRLRARGLRHKKAAIAVARKLIVLANTVLKRGSPWHSNAAAHG